MTLLTRNSSSESELDMENSMAVTITNKKVSNYFPHNLLLLILSKLPLKSLKRFLCVCKSWSFLFENPQFMNMYLNNVISDNHSDYDDTFLVLHKPVVHEQVPTFRDCNPCEFYWLSGERFENWVKLDWPHPFEKDDKSIYIVGSVSINGILCLKHGFRYTDKVVLWNPTTNESKVIPPSLVENITTDRFPWFVLHGFGYDHVNDDYKVIQMVDFFPDDMKDDDELKWEDRWEDRPYDPLWEIYSLKSNSWKKLDFDMRNWYYYSTLRSIGVYMDGMFHWWTKSEYKNIEQCLLSFDFSNEVLHTTSMPSNIDDKFNVGFVEKHLVLLNGSIALISSCVEATTFRISILGKLGVRESWINLFIVGPLPFLEFPIGVGKKNNIVFFNNKDDELVWVDLKTRVMEKLGVRGNRFACHIGKYKKSFLPIGGINNSLFSSSKRYVIGYYNSLFSNTPSDVKYT